MELQEGQKGDDGMEPTERKKLFLGKPIAIVLTGTIVLAAVVYVGMAVYFQSHFLPSTTLNERVVSAKSQEEVEQIITEQISGYELLLEERGGKEETIKGEEIGLKPEFGTSISDKIVGQNAYAWPAAFFLPKEYEEPTMVNFEEEKLKDVIKKLECMQRKNQESPKDAVCSEYTSDGYQIIPEEQGTKIEEKKLLSTLKEAIGSLKKSVSLEEKECYVKPKVTSEDKKLQNLVDTLNQYTNVTITYDAEEIPCGDTSMPYGNNKEKSQVLDGSITNKWLDVKDGTVSIREEAVEEYVEELAASYNTAFRRHTLKTSYGTTIEITNGDYGWKLDKAGEKEQILKDLKAGKSLKREPLYSQRAGSHGENDYGDTYVEINLTAQHLFFYKNGSLVVESDFVSGNISKNYDTPTGIYAITYKERDATLRGENYATPVKYWMPFCNNVGMHDASWRSRFGGSIYRTSGSHGCINLPPSVAQEIFENIEKGDPVIVYTLPGTQSAAALAEEAAQVVNLINSIGEVNLGSEPTILLARKLYDLLSPEGQAKVTNYELLLASEAQFAALKAAYAAVAQ